jgi:hypothetical protein
MTLEANEVFEDARQAVARFRKKFDEWIKIGRAVVLARDIADRRGGSRTFMRIVQQQGLGSVVTKSVASRLERIMPRVDEVTAWHATLTERQRIDWASPTTILRRCPIFRNPAPPSNEERLTPAQRDRQELVRLNEENHRLQTELAHREDGDTFNPRTSTPREIAVALFGQLLPYRGKAKRVARELTALVEDRNPREAADSPD